MIKKYLLLATFCLGHSIFGQKAIFRIPDTLQNKDYDYLFERIEESENKHIKQSLYLKSFLSKAKSEKNSEEILNGYKNYAYHSPENLKLVYADSMIYIAKKSMNNALLGSAYLSKGIIYYAQKKHNQALDNYLIANNFISKTNDKYLIYKVKYNIAHIKYYLGFYDEAISLFKECIGYFKEASVDGYLNSLHSLGLCYNHIGNYGLCTEVNEKGLLEGKRLANNEMTAYFIHSEGINQYFKNNYASAIKNIAFSIPAISKNKDFANEAVGYFYLGKSYQNLRKDQIALSYFKKVDIIFDNKGYIRPDLRENYELLINYYKSNNNLTSQLYYIEKLFKVDRILDNKYQYLSSKVHKEYDTKELLSQKNNIEKILDQRKYNDLIFTSVITILFLSLLLLTYIYFRNKEGYKRKFEELMKNSEIPKIEVKNTTKGIEDLNQEAVQAVLKQLERFESGKKFLEKDLTSIKLAVAFNSNVKYLSRVIFHYREKKFAEYINDLKIDYLISLLKKDKMFRNYTNKALGEEVGFSTTQRFTTAFFARTGMPTSYFIEELLKEQK
jgi:AraC-like DNA-binding protein